MMRSIELRTAKSRRFRRTDNNMELIILIIWLFFTEGSSAGFSCISNPCMHGVCIDHVNSTYSCYCEDGFTGYECQTNWNECWSQPCQNRATCIDMIASYKCLCPPGYTGRWCERQINECLSNPCLNNGTCQDLVDRYKCICPIGYKGVNCEIDVSSCNMTDAMGPRCKNNGVCIDGPGLSFTCLCPPGWEGKSCEMDLNECKSNPCSNLGICLNSPGSFMCACLYGFTGRFCESQVIWCKDHENYCENNALCVIENEIPTCYCVPDFHGSHCQYRYNDCLPFSPRCMNGGTCIDGVDSFRCSCPLNTSGVLCECLSTPQGRICEMLPDWFQEKDFYPLITNDTAEVPDVPTVYPEFPAVTESILYQPKLYETLYPDRSILFPSEMLATYSVTETFYDIETETPIFLVQPTIESTIVETIHEPTPTLTDTFLTAFPDAQTPHILLTSVPLESRLDISETYFPTDIYPTSIASEILLTSVPYTELMTIVPSLYLTTSPEEPEIGVTPYPENETMTPVSVNVTFPFESTPISDEPEISPLTDFASTEATSETTEIISLTDEYVFNVTEEFTTKPDNFTFSVTEFPDETATYSTINISAFFFELFNITTPAISSTEDFTIDTTKDVFTVDTSDFPTELTIYAQNMTPPSISTLPTEISTTVSIPTTEEERPFTDVVFLPNETFTTLFERPTENITTVSPEVSLMTSEDTITFTDGEILTEKTTSDISTEVTTPTFVTIPILPAFDSTPDLLTDSLSTEPTTYPEKMTPSDYFNVTLFPLSTTEPTDKILTTKPYTETTEVSAFTQEGLTLTPHVDTTLLKEETDTPPYMDTTSLIDETKPTDFPPENRTTDLGTEVTQTTTVDYVTTSTLVHTSCLTLTCFNGGSCIILQSGNAVCHCPFNYFGFFCETYRYVSQPYFKGSSYLKIGTTELLLRKGVKMYIQFASESPNGLLSYSEGNADTFFMLLLRNSLLQFVFSCGLQTVSFLQGNRKLTVNAQTNVSIRIWWSPYSDLNPWGRGKCKASLQVNDSSPVYSEQEAASSRVRLGNVFLGGLPSSYSSPLVIKAGFLPRFRGCISLLEIDEIEIDPWLSAIEGEDVEECGSTLCPLNACFNGGSCVPGIAKWSCVCPEGFEGMFCEKKLCDPNPCFNGVCVRSPDDEGFDPFCLCPAELKGPLCKQPFTNETSSRLSYTGSFKGYTSFSSHRINFEHRKNIVIRLHFTTRLPYQLGLMFYLGRPVNSAIRDFFALAIVRGYLMLTWDLGAGPRRLLSPEPLDYTWHTHSVRIGRNRREAWLEVDTQGKVSGMAPGFLSSLETNGILYLGGHPSWNLSHLPVDLSRLQGFQGCIFDVRVAKVEGGPWIAPPPLTSLGVTECGKDVCSGHLCSNGAVCQPVSGTYRCLCSPGWKGPFCTVASHRCDNSSVESCAPGSSCIISEGDNRTKCLCSFGKVGPRCEQETNITDPLFSGDKSFLSLRIGKVLRRYSSVSFEFKPLSDFGILFLAVPITPNGDYMSLLIDNGNIYFIYKLGKESMSSVEIRSTKKIVKGQWQDVSLTRNGRKGTLNFASETIVSSPRYFPRSLKRPRRHLQSMAEFLDVQEEVFFGGYPEKNVLGNEVSRLKNIPNFKGCLRKMVIGDTAYSLDQREHRMGILKGQGISDCDGTACGAEVCANGGTCVPDINTHSFSCNCTKNYEGRRCEVAGQCLNNRCRTGGICQPTGLSIKMERRGEEERNLASDSSDFEQDSEFDGYICLCPPTKSGKYCEKESKISSALFRGKSYAVVHQGSSLPFINPLKDGFSLNFTTSEDEGLILWRGNDNESGDYIGLGIHKKKLKLVWHLGGEVIGQIISKEFVSDSKWHTVTVFRGARIATLYLDGSPYKTGVEGNFLQLNAPNKFYIGGFPEGISLRYRTDLHFLEPFVGCLKDVNIHPTSTPVLFSELKEGRDLQPCPPNTQT